MSFSIVQTIENGAYLITTVPHNWVTNNGTLNWPPNKTILMKLRKNGNSVPETSWTKYPCVVKKTGFPSYDHALKMEKEMLDWSCSESEPQIMDKFLDVKKKRWQHADTSQKLLLSQISNFDNMFENNNSPDHLMASSPEPTSLQQHRSPSIFDVNAVCEPNMLTAAQNNIDQADLQIDNGTVNMIETGGNDDIVSCDIANFNKLLNFDFGNCKYLH